MAFAFSGVISLVPCISEGQISTRLVQGDLLQSWQSAPIAVTTVLLTAPLSMQDISNAAYQVECLGIVLCDDAAACISSFQGSRGPGVGQLKAMRMLLLPI